MQRDSEGQRKFLLQSCVTWVGNGAIECAMCAVCVLNEINVLFRTGSSASGTGAALFQSRLSVCQCSVHVGNSLIFQPTLVATSTQAGFTVTRTTERIAFWIFITVYFHILSKCRLCIEKQTKKEINMSGFTGKTLWHTCRRLRRKTCAEASSLNPAKLFN